MTAASPAPLNMVLGQLITNQVQDPRLLNALLAVPRESFVPPSLRGSAYTDEEVPLGQGRRLMSPLAFARLLTLADVQPGERVLDIASATGYSSAVLAQLCRQVTACETVSEFNAEAERNLRALGLNQVHIRPVKTLSEGAAAQGPYDVIFINGAVEQVPEGLTAQLAEGGRLVAVLAPALRTGLARGMGRLMECKKIGGKVFTRESVETAAAVLPGFEKPVPFRL